MVVTARFKALLLALTLTLILTACLPAVPPPSQSLTSRSMPSRSMPSNQSSPKVFIWASSFESSQWQDDWKIQRPWGLENTAIVVDQTGRFPQVLRVNFPAGSSSPAAARSGSPTGGAQFYGTQISQNIAAQTQVRLSYFLRFSDNFDFVKGGKLPGLYGGKGNSGGEQSNGSDGFSTRFMWRRNGEGEVYGYLPKRDEKPEPYGTSIGRGRWAFKPGIWYQIEQELKLNTPDRADGSIRVWIDERLVLEELNLKFRNDPDLHIDGIFFSTFFGGSDRTWATPKPVHIDFADFKLLQSSP